MTWLARWWDFVDRRDIDKHLVCWCVLYGTVILTRWAMAFAWQSERQGLEIAAIIAAVTAPYMVLQGSVVAFYFKSRTK